MVEQNIEDRLALEHFLPYRLSVLSGRVSQKLANTYQKRFGLTIPEWRVLAILGRHQPLSAGQVAERGAMDKVKVSRAVSGLLRRGLVSRHANPDDQRQQLLRFNLKGQNLYQQVAPLALAWEAHLLACLNETEIHTLHQLLDRLDERIRKMK